MSDPVYILLWRRVRFALLQRGALPPGNATESEMAAYARKVLGTDLIQRFVQDYYNDLHYGAGYSKLSDAEAEELVVAVEELPQKATVEKPQSRTGDRSHVTANQAGHPTPLKKSSREIATDFEEAVGYGWEEAARAAAQKKAAEKVALAATQKKAAEEAALAAAQKKAAEEAARAAAQKKAAEEAALAAAQKKTAEEAALAAAQQKAAEEQKRQRAANQKRLEDDERQRREAEERELQRRAREIATQAEASRRVEEKKQRAEEMVKRRANSEADVLQRPPAQQIPIMSPGLRVETSRLEKKRTKGSLLARLGRAILQYFFNCLIFVFVFMPLVLVPLILAVYLASYLGIQKSNWVWSLASLIWVTVVWNILPDLFPSVTRLIRRVAGFDSHQN